MSSWLGAKAIRTWQLETMLSLTAVLIQNLPDVLSDQVRPQAISSHVRKRVAEEFHSFERWKFIDKKKEAMFVPLLCGSLKVHFFRKPVHNHCKDQADQRTEPDFV